jgi:hypothetical protein
MFDSRELGIENLMEMYPPTASLNGYPNIAILYSDFSLDDDR